MRRTRRISSLCTLAVLVLVLAGCAEEASGPQFANNPVATRAPTDVAAATPALLPRATPRPMATPSSIGDLLRTRGAASKVFIASGDAVWAITSSGEASAVFSAPEGARVLAIDSAPGATLVAVLVGHGAAAPGRYELLVVDEAGEVLERWMDFAPTGATPVSRANAGGYLVDWSPQGDRILVGLPTGALFDVHFAEDDPSVLAIDTAGATVVQPTWSPTGEAIAFVAVTGDGQERELRVFHPGSGDVTTAVAPLAGRFVVEFVWMPDGVSLLFTEGGELGGAVSGIDLWRVRADGANRQLLASAGSVAPVAQIGTMRPSPDGRSVAYVVLVPGDRSPRVDSIWVRDIASGVGYRIPLPSVDTVEDIWWTDKGLVVSVTTDGSGPDRRPMLALLQLKPDGAVAALWVAPLASASPVAGTPVATPVATPASA